MVDALLAELGVGPALAAAVAVVAREEPRDATPAQRVVAAAVTAAMRHRDHGDVLVRLLDWLEGHLDELTGFDIGRYWHLRGVSAWRHDGLVFVATRAFNQSIAVLADATDPRAHPYLARIHDSFGQMLYHQGRLGEARHELELALAGRAADDVVGRALTHGNLGRLYLDLGEFGQAAEQFENDLALIERSGGDERLRGQLHHHLGDCLLRDGWIIKAERHFRQAYVLAGADPAGIAFAMLGLGRGALERGRVDVARTIALAVRDTDLHVDARTRATLSALAWKLVAGCDVAVADHAHAITAYHAAIGALAQGDASPIVRAEILRGLARTERAHRQSAVAAEYLRDALVALDATTAAGLRRDIENELHAVSDLAWVAHSAGRFIGRDQLDDVLRRAGSDGYQGELRRLTILFSDIRGFTSLSERLAPDALVQLLNDFLTAMTRCLEYHGGAVDKFIGDAVMAVFPRDEAVPSSPIDAALAMRDELVRINRFARDAAPDAIGELSIGIGIHTGDVVSGLIGSPQRRSLTVIGDAVNTASRLEGMTKQLGASILISDTALASVERARYLLRPLGKFAPKNKAGAIAVYDVMGMRDRSPESRNMEAEIAEVTTALAMLEVRRFEAAASMFAALGEKTGRTSRAVGYRMLCDVARDAMARPDGWTGKISLQNK